MRKVWTTGDLARVANLAGTMPSRELRRKLKLSKNQLAYAINQLHKMGVAVSTRYYESKLELCPACGQARSTIDKSGICRPCKLKRQLIGIEWRISDLLTRLPAHERSIYETTEAERESNSGTKPEQSTVCDASRYTKSKTADDYAIALERWETDYLERKVRAAQKRKERIERKVKGKE